MTRTMFGIASTACTVFIAAAAMAQETEAGGLSVELNAATAAEGRCTLSFLITNEYEKPVEKAVFETVLFDDEGQVDRLTLLDFGQLPPGRPRVRQFTLPDTSCDAIGRILVNGANTCEAPELGPSACTEGLRLSTRTDIELIG